MYAPSGRKLPLSCSQIQAYHLEQCLAHGRCSLKYLLNEWGGNLHIHHSQGGTSPGKWGKTSSPQYWDSVKFNSFHKYMVIHRPHSSQNTESKKITPGRKILVITEFIHYDVLSTWATHTLILDPHGPRCLVKRDSESEVTPQTHSQFVVEFLMECFRIVSPLKESWKFKYTSEILQV